MHLENSLTAARTESTAESAGPIRTFARRHPLILYVLLAYTITTLGWLPSILNRWTMAQTPLPLALLAGWGPSLAGLLASALLDGWSGVKGLGRRFVQKGVGLRWYGLAALSIPLLWSLAMLLHLALGRPLDFVHLGVYDWFPVESISPWLLILPVSLFMMLTGGAMNEEFGWRGFMLPRLLDRRSPLTASLMLAPLWWAWHLPQMMMPGASSQSGLLSSLLTITLNTILITWLFTKTRGSILIVVLFHTALNVSSAFFPSTLQPTVDWMRIGLAVLIVLSWLRTATGRGRGVAQG